MAADTAMVPESPFAPKGGPVPGGIAALKYATQADRFQDDPNFYSWLEDWIGKNDEDSTITDAFNTLNDYGNQYEWQQQQQQEGEGGAGAAVPQQQPGPEPIPNPAGSRATDTAATPTPTLLEALTAAVASCKEHASVDSDTLMTTAGPQAHGQQPGADYERARSGGAAAAASSCASLTSNPSNPSSNNPSDGDASNHSRHSAHSFGCVASPSESCGDHSYGVRTAPSPLPTTPPFVTGLPPAAAAAVGPSFFASAVATSGGPTSTAGLLSAFGATSALAAVHTGNLGIGMGPGLGLGSGLGMVPGLGTGTGTGLGMAPRPDGMPVTGVDAQQSLMAELRNFLARDASGTSLTASLASSSLGALSSHNLADRVPSHGTVSSFVGVPPPALAIGAAAASAALSSSIMPAVRGLGMAAPPVAAPAAPAAVVAGTSSVAAAVGVVPLDQLLARALYGRSAGFPSTGSNSGSTTAAVAAATAAAAGTGAAGCSPAGMPALLMMPRNSSGAEGMAGIAMSYGRSSGEYGSGGGSGCEEGGGGGSRTGSGQLLPQGPSGLAGGAGAVAGGAAGGAAGGRSGSRLPRKSSCGGLAAGPHGSHSHGHGIPVSHAHGHGHVGKTTTAGHHQHGPSNGHHHGSNSHHTARGHGINATGRPTRTARTKAMFTALEAELAGKLGELEVLQREHTSLTQKVEILEVAVERQNVVLNLMNPEKAAAHFGAGGAAGAFHPLSAPSAAANNGIVGDGTVWAAAAAAAGGGGLAGLYAAASGGVAGGRGGGGGLAAGGLMDALAVVPRGPEGAKLLEWARNCTVDNYREWYGQHLQRLSLALLEVEDVNAAPEAEARLVQMVAGAAARTCLVGVFQPLTQLRLKGLHFETNAYIEPPDSHWLEVIKFMSVGPQQVAEMENLFHSYNLLHDSFRAELQDTQRELAELVAQQDNMICTDRCTDSSLVFVLKQTNLLKRVRSILQKTHLLYSCTIGVAAMRILKPKEFAKCCVQSYPYFPCGPSLMKACAQLRTMKMWGLNPCGDSATCAPSFAPVGRS